MLVSNTVKGAFKYHITLREGGGGFSRCVMKALDRGEGVCPMCDKKVITLNIRDFILKITKNSLKRDANLVMTKVIMRDNGGVDPRVIME